MFHYRHKTLIALSGTLWLLVGVFLLQMGLRFVVESAGISQAAVVSSTPLLRFISQFTGTNEQSAIVIIAVGLMIGFFKGRYVLAKSVSRLVGRIKSFAEPTHFTKMYTLPYLLLILLMVAIGMSIKFLGVPQDIRGFIDVAIGAALINGAMLYYRAAVS